VFNFLKNPFDKLTAENQEEMKTSLKMISDAFYGDEGVLGLLSIATEHLKSIADKLDVLNNTVLTTNAKTTEFDEKALDKAGKGAVVMGDGIMKIVEAIKIYEKIDDKTIDRFISGIEKIGESFEKISEGIKTMELAGKVLMNMAGGIILFGLALLISGPIYLLALPLAPIVIGVIMGVFWLFTKILGGKDGKNLIDGAQALMWMAGAIFLFGVALYLAGMVYAELWKGMLGMVAILLTIMAVVGIFWLMDGLSDTIGDGVKALLWMVLVIVGVGVVLYLASFVYAELWKGFVGMLAILLTIGALVGLMMLIDMFSGDIYDGVKALGLMVLVVVLVGVLLYVAGKFYSELYDGLVASWPILIVIGALIGLMFLIDMMSNTIYDGALALLAMVGAAFAAALLLYMISDWSDEMAAGLGASWPLLILMGALIGLMYLLNGAKKEMLMGALVLGAMAVALMVLSLALQVYQSTAVAAGFDMASMGLLLLTIAGLAVEMGIIGIPVVAGFVALGALTMVAVSASILVLGYALKEWKTIGFQDKDAKDLQKAVIRIPMAFLGLTGDEGFFGAIAQAAKTTVVLAAATVNALMMLAIGASLYTLGTGLKAFKDTGFTPADANNISLIISSVAGAFAKVTRDGGDDWSWWDVKMGIWAMEDLGGVLVGIADGVQKWANLYVSKYEYNESKGEMVETDRVQLTKTDFENVAYGMAQVIGALAIPLAQVGMAEQGSGGGIWAGIFGGGGYVSAGIQALSGVGDVLTGLAKGVQAFADLKFTTYEIVDAGTKDAKMVPKEVLTITDKVLDTAVGNIGKVILSVAKPFGMIGQGLWGKLFTMAAGGDVFPYSAEDIKTGIDALTGVGDVLSGLAKGVQDFANMTFTTYEVVGAGTKDAKIMPKTVLTLGSKDIDNATSNIGKVILAVAKPFGMIGQGFWSRLISGSEFPYDADDISEGVKSLTGVGAILSGLAKGVQDFANMTFTTYEVKGEGANAKIVPKDILTLTSADLDKATTNMTNVILAVAKAFGRTTDYLKEHEDDLGLAFELLPKLSKTAVSVSDAITKVGEMSKKFPDSTKLAKSITDFISAVISPFNEQLYPTIRKDIWNFGIFTKDVSELAKNATAMQKIDKSFSGIAKSMNTFQSGINKLKMQPLSETRGLFEAMAIIAESGSAEQIIKKYSSSIDKTLQKLAEILEKFAKKAAPPPVAPPPSGGTGGGTGTGTGKGGTGKGTGGSNNDAALLAELSAIRTALQGTLKVKGPKANGMFE
jgi:hypothetical protein